MKTYFFITVLVVTIFTACKNKDTITAMQFSDEIVKMEQSLIDPIFKTEIQIKAYADSSNYKGVAQAAEEMEGVIEEKVKKIKTMDATGFKGGVDFKTVAIRYFEYIKNLYTTYKEIGNAPDEKARVDASTKMNTILGAQPDVTLKMKEAQAKFAMDNGFRVETVPAP